MSNEEAHNIYNMVGLRTGCCQITELVEKYEQLQQENKELKGQLETYEILFKTNEPIINGWNKLKKYLEEVKDKPITLYVGGRASKMTIEQARLQAFVEVLDTMKEIGDK